MPNAAANPPSKPALNGGNNTAPPPSAAKSQFRQQPYPPPPHRRNLCCCCCFWSLAILLALALLANGSLPAFTSAAKNQTVLHAAVSGGDLDADSAATLRSDLKRRGGAPLRIEMDTKVKVGIRVTCDGIHGAPPQGKSPAVASVSDAACKVDLRANWKSGVI